MWAFCPRAWQTLTSGTSTMTRARSSPAARFGASRWRRCSRAAAGWALHATRPALVATWCHRRRLGVAELELAAARWTTAGKGFMRPSAAWIALLDVGAFARERGGRRAGARGHRLICLIRSSARDRRRSAVRRREKKRRADCGAPFSRRDADIMNPASAAVGYHPKESPLLLSRTRRAPTRPPRRLPQQHETDGEADEVMAKQVTATSAISGPMAATSARGGGDAVVVIARAFWAFTAGAANWAFTDLRRRTERARERKESVVSRFAETTRRDAKTRDCQVARPSTVRSERDDKGRFELGGPRGGGTHTRAERFLPAGATARVELRGEGGWGRTVSQTRARSDAGRASAPCFAGARSG